MYTIVSLYDSNIVLLSRKANVFMVSSMQTDSVSIDFIDENVFTFINEESRFIGCFRMYSNGVVVTAGLVISESPMKVNGSMGLVGDSPRNRNNHKLSGDEA